jgi:hypothetical protein
VNDSFTIFDVFRDAATLLRATWARHVAFNAVFVAIAILSCCGMMCALVPVAGLLGDSHTDEPAPELVPIMYVAMGILGTLLLALHEGVTLGITHAHARGEVATLRAAIDRALRRGPSITGAVVLRTLIDLSVPVLVLSAGAALAVIALPDAESETRRTIGAIGGTVVYLTGLGWLLSMRGCFGLAVSLVVRDGIGTRAAFERSLASLRGRRWHFVGFRLAWMLAAIASYCLALSPIFAVAALAGDALADDRNATVLLVIPLFVVVYGVMLALLAIDSVLVGSYHARLEAKVDGATVAKVFE